MNDDDRALLEKIQGGDAESFGTLYDRTRSWLLSFVIVPRVGACDAEDVLAETFHTALHGIRQFEWRGVGLLHWLSAIARRKAQESQRNRHRSRGRDEGDDALLDLPDNLPTAEAAMIHGEQLLAQRERVATTLERINPRYAEALRLRLLDGRDRPDCAHRLGVSTATFDVVLLRATRAFAKAWRTP